MKLSFNTEGIDTKAVSDILNFKDLKYIKIFLTCDEKDINVKFIDCAKSDIKLSGIERVSLSGYNYLITIFINEM